MCENAKFVWEGSRTVYYYKAKKFDTWTKMKTLKNSIEESIKEAKELLDIAKKANEYGVLTTSVYYTFNNKTRIDYITQKNGEIIFSIDTPYSEKENIINEITNDPIKTIEKFIEDLKNELKMQKEYMKEAEPYLTVHIS